jgi:hypothetical protein
MERKFDGALVAQINDTLKQAATSRRPRERSRARGASGAIIAGRLDDWR